MLIQLEAVAHDQDSYAVKECLRTSLGSTASAEFSRNLFKSIRHKPRDHVNWFTTFLRVLLLTFAIRTFAYGLDMFTDLILLFDYYRVVAQLSLTLDSSALTIFLSKSIMIT